MPRFPASDGTSLAYRTVGDGPPLVCLPGGPGQAPAYLGDLGGLAASRTLVLLDNRGTGASGAPADPGTYRVDRLVEDVEALRCELGLRRIDLLGHSAGGGPVLLYAAIHPERLGRLVLANPSLRVLGLASDLGRETVLAQRATEPWYDQAIAAIAAARDAPTFAEAVTCSLPSAPLSYGARGTAARAHAAAAPSQYSQAAHDGFYAGFTPDPAVPARLAALLPTAELAIQPGAGPLPMDRRPDDLRGHHRTLPGRAAGCGTQHHTLIDLAMRRGLRGFSARPGGDRAVPRRVGWSRSRCGALAAGIDDRGRGRRAAAAHRGHVDDVALGVAVADIDVCLDFLRGADLGAAAIEGGLRDGRMRMTAATA